MSLLRAIAAFLCVSALVFSSGCNLSKLRSSGGDEGGAPAAAPPGLGLSFLNTFEGEIDAIVKAKEDKPGAAPMPVSVFIQSGKLRFDIPEKMTQGMAANMLGPKAYAIFDSSAKKLYIVSDTQRQVIVIDLNKSGEELKGFGKPPETPHGGGGNAPSGPATKITKTGKYDTVAGYKCENWDITSDHREGTVCVAQEGVSWFSIPMTGIPTEHAWALELLDGKHFPLRFVGYEKDGTTEESRIEITKIDQKKLPATEFEYPPTYRVVDLAQMFAGFGKIPGGMPGAPGGMPMPPHKPH
jgi:hypothetical protein